MAQPPFNQDPYGHNPYQAPGSNLYTQEEHGDKLTIDQAIESGYDYDVLAILSEAWAATNGFKLPMFLVGLTCFAIFFVIYFVLAIFVGITMASSFGLTTGIIIAMLVIYLIMAVLFWILSAGPISMALNHLRGQPVEFTQLFSGFSRVQAILLSSLVIVIFSQIPSIPSYIFSSGIMSKLAILMSLIGSIYIIVSYLLNVWIIMDHPEVTFWESMEGSRKLISQHFFKMLLLVILLWLIIFALPAISITAFAVGKISGFTFLIGLVLSIVSFIRTFPMSTLAIGSVYRIIFQK